MFTIVYTHRREKLPPGAANVTLLRWLTATMFFMLAVTTDAVGVIIPEAIRQHSLSMTAASAFHYATMGAVAITGIALGFLADRLGRKAIITIGLTIFGTACCLFAIGSRFEYFVVLLVASGCAIALFKIGALALLGDISTSTSNHTSNMNTLEGFAALGSIMGPAVITYFLAVGISWKYLYFFIGIFCLLLMLANLSARYPSAHGSQARRSPETPISLAQALHMLNSPHVLGLSMVIALYVATEVAVIVWMPTFLGDYHGSASGFAVYALTGFFMLRAAGRFFGAWILRQYAWQVVLLGASLAIAGCYLGSMVFGVGAAVYLLPLSGLFMSVIYPTLNSKGISCVPKSQHGSVAGVILFFTAVGAALSPLIMGAVSDFFGHVKYGFYLASGFSGLFSLCMLYNWLYNPTQALLQQSDSHEYQTHSTSR